MKYELFNVRDIEDYNKYYPLLKKWWKDKEWHVIKPEFLSTRGIIIKDKDYICACWLYTTDSLYGVINHIISDDKSDGKTKRQCIEYMLDVVSDYSKYLGIKCIYTAMETRSLKKILEEKGFSKTSDNISEYCKII